MEKVDSIRPLLPPESNDALRYCWIRDEGMDGAVVTFYLIPNQRAEGLERSGTERAGI